MSSTKRKLDDFIDDASLTTLPHQKDLSTLPFPSPSTSMRKDHSTLSPSLPSTSSSSSLTPRLNPRHNHLQFFVRVFSDKTLVMTADLNDVVFTLHERIQTITKIPITEQRLIYNGRQLPFDKTLAECSLSNDANLHLVGRLRSTGNPLTWQLMLDLVGLVFNMCKYKTYVTKLNNVIINEFITKFLSMTPQQNDFDQCRSHLDIFMTSAAPLALVTLYMSVFGGNKGIAADAIRHFVNESRNVLNNDVFRCSAGIVLEFCKLLRSGVGRGDDLYVFCRGSLGGMVGGEGGEDLVDVREVFEFVRELAGKLAGDLVTSMGLGLFVGVSGDDVRDLGAFLCAVRNGRGIMSKLLNGNEELEFLRGVFEDLMEKMELCLEKMGGFLAMTGKEELERISARWEQYLAILKELNGVAKMFEGAEELFWEKLLRRKDSLCYLIIKFAKRSDDHKWILAHKEVTNFEARRHLVMMMFPDVKEDYGELHEMLIDRSQLLEESFAYIIRAEAESLHGGIFMEFKNEEATGPGVLREWFFLVCQAIFDPQNALFVACPNDRRRFFPNPASKVDPLHLEYFSFSGRIIALALMHKIQVGIVFDRVFFVQLSGKNVCLEDISDADPYLYNSCKAILEMDASIVDQDALGLTFVREVYELGTRKVVELCPGGKNISVTSKNREEYVDLLIQHNFVTSIAEQVAHFTRGFADILNRADTQARALLQKSLFEGIDLEDFDWMLHGSGSTICVEDWMAHIEYEGFKETDPQIRWFWKIVGKMSAEQRKVLLFFWTSIKFLPVEGFRGLASPLYIYKTHESSNRLPSSHTCFYRLCFPAYPSEKMMQDRLHLITQEHVGCSFGTW